MGDATALARVDVRTGVVAELGDLVGVASAAGLAGLAVVVGAVDGPLRVLLAALLVGVFPGYGIVAALFPGRTPLVSPGRGSAARLGHRVALALPASLFVVVLAGIPVSLLGLPFSPPVAVGTVVGITFVGCLVAALRRSRLPASERVRLPIAEVGEELRAGLKGPRIDAALNVLLAVAVVAAVGAFAVGLAAPDRGAAYSEVALLTEEDGELVAGNFTETYRQGEEASLTLAIENQEGAETGYTTVVALERLGGADNQTSVLERVVLANANATVQDGETVTRTLSVTPSMLGEELRLSVYVYAGDAPDSVRLGSADYHLYRWIEVREDDGSGG